MMAEKFWLIFEWTVFLFFAGLAVIDFGYFLGELQPIYLVFGFFMGCIAYNIWRNHDLLRRN